VHKFGHYVYWAGYDIQLDILDTIRSLNDPKYAQKKQVAALTKFQEYGNAIRALRKDCDLSQDAVAQAAGLDKKTIGRIERGEYPPTYQSLEKLARAHSLKTGDYMKAIAQKVQKLRQPT
jgi:DNA-binding XRE family transcriptional regulator